MQNKLAVAGRRYTARVVSIQVLAAGALVAIAAVVKPHIWQSVFLGMITFVLPYAVYAFFAFRFAGGSQIREVADNLYRGVRIRLALTIVLFALSFLSGTVAPSWFFGAYVTAFFVHWIVIAILKAPYQ